MSLNEYLFCVYIANVPSGFALLPFIVYLTVSVCPKSVWTWQTDRTLHPDAVSTTKAIQGEMTR
jgi:hypothetical protein